ncbi:FecR family protein [Brucella sp. NBRC 12950]|uniref:FecR family protein n=1 Tax=Brucella sp. NBRC 12950 TaxID=2994518 RepID=UPI0024A30FA1|nr:FecR family protein [Brucella sp. NBRC 12950]GLU27567.1 iron dicitrate transporter FecR [Brucella sp. NBRC 12950]
MKEKTTVKATHEPDFSHKDPVTDAALNWLFLLQGVSPNSPVKAEFEAWLNSSPDHRRTFEQVSKAWALPEADLVAFQLANFTISNQLDKSGASASPVHKGIRQRHRLSWAMVTAAAVILAVGIWQYPALLLEWQADYITATGQTYIIVLPDGSKLTLNTASAVKLDFVDNHRSVELLQGEAYFDVVPDPLRPFKVTASFSEVVVKGTAFSVRKDLTQDIIVLEHGKVEVTKMPDRLMQAVLLPGESIRATLNDFSPVVKTDTGEALSWVRGQLSFKDRPLSSVLDELSRYYPHSIITLNTELASTRVNGRYRLDNPELAIRSLVTAAGGSVSRIPGGILILQ